MLHKPSAKHRTDGRGDGGEAGPGSDRAAPFAAGKDALMSARLPGTSSAPPTPCTARAAMSWPILAETPHHAEAMEKRTTPDAKDSAASVEIAERAACKQQRGKKEGVAFHHPLHVGNRRVQGRLQDGQGHIDDGAVDERHARTQDRRRQHPRLPVPGGPIGGPR